MGWASIQKDWGPCKMRQRHTYMGRMPCEDGGRDWSDVSTSQGMPKVACKPLQGKRCGTDSPHSSQKSLTRLTPWSQASGLWNLETAHVCCFIYLVCPTLSWELWETNTTPNSLLQCKTFSESFIYALNLQKGLEHP